MVTIQENNFPSADFKEVGTDCLVEGWDCLIAWMGKLDEGDVTKEMRDNSPSPIGLGKEQQTVSRSKRDRVNWGRSHELGETWTSQRR